MTSQEAEFEELNCRLEVVEAQRNVALRDHAVVAAKLKMANARIEVLEREKNNPTLALVR